MGGYTALAAVGGKPMAFPHEDATGQSRSIPVIADRRVKALVLLAPAAAWFAAEGSLSQVATPVLMLTAEHDPYTPAEHAAIIKKGVADPALVDHREIRGAGHFSFVNPFPPALCRADFPPSQDPPGFDRSAFNAVMNSDILAFLRTAL